jgi:hypothetical protein
MFFKVYNSVVFITYKELCFRHHINFRTFSSPQKEALAGHQWLVPVILATQEAEMRRIAVRSQPGQTV